MKDKLWLSALAILVAPLLLDASDLDNYKQKYTTGLAAINASYDTELSEILQAYGKGLSTIQMKAQAAGELDALKAVLAELERFEKEEKLAADATAILPSVRPLYQNCQRRIQDAGEGRAQKAATLNAQYASALERLQRDLTKKGELEEATAVQAERMRLGESRTVHAETCRAAEQPASLEPVATRSSPVPIDAQQWRSVIWNKRASRWQKESLDNLSTRQSPDEFWVKNTSRVHRAAKIALRDSLVGDFTVVTEIKGRFGIELMHTSGESDRGYGVYGFPTDEWLRLVVTRKGEELSIQCSDGQSREFKGKQGNSRVPLDFCISLSQESEIQARHFQHGRGAALALAEQGTRMSDSLSAGSGPRPQTSPATSSPASAPSQEEQSGLFAKYPALRAEHNEFSAEAHKLLQTGTAYELQSILKNIERRMKDRWTKNQRGQSTPIEGAEQRELATAYQPLADTLRTTSAQREDEEKRFSALESEVRDNWHTKDTGKLTSLIPALQQAIAGGKGPAKQKEIYHLAKAPFPFSDFPNQINSHIAEIEGEQAQAAAEKTELHAIYAKYKEQKAKSVQFKDVVFDPEKYKGVVVECDVHMDGPGPFFFPFLSFNESFMMDATPEIWKKCDRAFSAIGKTGTAHITFVGSGTEGVRGVLLDIKPK